MNGKTGKTQSVKKYSWSVPGLVKWIALRMPDFFHSFLQRANADGSRSTAMTDLRWFLAILVFGLLAAFKYNAPVWILVVLAVLLVSAVLLFMGMYVFFAVRSPDLLRSEKFTLSKMAIEHTLKGDNLAGFLDMPQQLPLAQTPAKNDLKNE